ncbi:MAG: toll/interleukin-1 receptor domain-containing protein [Ignavibacteriaceae bacterium]|nr:toll/interleukin-1 receptor domain-containing protein [Ignavibacteriaceae bacterium]
MERQVYVSCFPDNGNTFINDMIYALALNKISYNNRFTDIINNLVTYDDIRAKINTSDVFLYFVSINNNNSYFSIKEYEYAIALGKYIVLIIYENDGSLIPYQLRGNVKVDFRNTKELVHKYEILINLICKSTISARKTYGDTSMYSFDPLFFIILKTYQLSKTAISKYREYINRNMPIVSSDGRGENEFTLTDCQTDEVDCSLFTPRVAQPGSAILVQVFAHIPDLIKEAKAYAFGLDDKTKYRGITSLGTIVKKGENLSFKLTMDNCEIDEPFQEIIWKGKTTRVSFKVSIPSSTLNGNTIGKLYVYQNTVPIGSIKFSLQINKELSYSEGKHYPAGQATRYKLAFISYSRKDKNKVLERVHLLPTFGIRYYQDIFDLEPGVVWKKKLCEFIDESNIMLLFWSTNAKKSEAVRSEWEYALKNKEEGYIRPVPIEGPPIPEPPEELKHINFDELILHIKK